VQFLPRQAERWDRGRAYKGIYFLSQEADIDASPSVHAEIQSRPLLLSHMPPMPRMSMLLHKSFFSQSQSRMPRPKH